MRSEGIRVVLMTFLGQIDGIARHFNEQIVVTHDHLAGKARMGSQTPSFVELIFFIFLRRSERCISFSDDDVASGAGAGFFAGVFDFDAIFQQGIAQKSACFGVE